MNYYKLTMLFLTVCLIFAPVSDAWTWSTHSSIVDSTYYSLPNSIHSKLSLSAMRDGSNDPDQIFHDYRDHSYPYSYNKAIYYLNQGSSYYKQKKYYLASKSFGIASHYISDTFSAPHCVSGESSSQHQAYENQASKLKPHVTAVNGNLKLLMYQGYTSEKSDWTKWQKTHSTSYTQKDLNRAASITFMAINNSINSNKSTNNVPTNTHKYIGNSYTKKFHLNTCRYVSQISSDHVVYFSTRQAAVNAGYTPCKVCNP
jgi:hypothetical protein